MRNLWIVLTILLSASCNANELQCKYKKSFVEETIPLSSDIKETKWSHGTDSDSGEHLVRLSIQYKSGNKAVIEHKYCDMYNFELTYNHYGYSLMSESDIASHVIEAYEMSKIKPKFKKELKTIILKELSHSGFNSKEPFSVGLSPGYVIFDDNIEYGIEYTPADKNLKSSEMIFYMSVGGL